MSRNLLIAIPFYSQKQYLFESIESVLKQTDPQWELIILDDSVDPAETQSVSQACEKFRQESRHAKITYQRNPVNLGMAANWNQAFELGSDFLGVTILHADDRLLPDYVKEMRRALQAQPDATAFFCKTKIINEKGNRAFSFADWYKNTLVPKSEIFELQGTDGVQHLIPGNYIFCPSLCFNPLELGAFRFDPQYKMVLDLDLILRILSAGKKLIGLYQKSLYEYRRHSQNATQSYTQNLLRFEEESVLIQKYSKTPGVPKIVRLNLGYLAVCSFLTGNFVLSFRLFRRLVVAFVS